MEKISKNVLSALVLTFNEEDNIERVLDKLQWLETVVILDSHSTDRTVELVQKYPNTEIYYRNFDTHSTQWNHGLSLVKSKWVLTLDADYVLTPGFITELQLLMAQDVAAAYFTHFKFAVFGKPLRRDNTTPRPVLFQRELCRYFDDGHTQRLSINGSVGFFKSFIIHDDRKSLSRWLKNLDQYSIKECDKLMDPAVLHRNSMVLRIRKTKILAPFLVFFYCLLVNGSFLDGWRGWHYTLQRTMVEILFALRLIEEEKLKVSSKAMAGQYPSVKKINNQRLKKFKLIQKF